MPTFLKLMSPNDLETSILPATGRQGFEPFHYMMSSAQYSCSAFETQAVRIGSADSAQYLPSSATACSLMVTPCSRPSLTKPPDFSMRLRSSGNIALCSLVRITAFDARLLVLPDSALPSTHPASPVDSHGKLHSCKMLAWLCLFKFPWLVQACIDMFVETKHIV